MTRKIRSWIADHQLSIFFLIAFGYTWTFQILASELIPEKVQNLSVFIPSIYGPTIAALLLPLISDGPKGLIDFLKKRLSGKINFIWYLISVFGIPVLLLVLRGIHLIIFPEHELNPLNIDRSVLQIFQGFLMMLPFGPLAEELGWRGFAVPRMQEKMNPLMTSLVFGLIWWAWHLPQLLIPQLQWSVGGMPVLIYLLMIMPGSILASWLFNNVRGSVIPVILFHTSMNYFMGLLAFNSPYAFPVITAGLWVAAIIAVLISGPDLILNKSSLHLPKVKVKMAS